MSEEMSFAMMGPWPRRLSQGVVRMIAPAELRGWIVYEDERLIVLNKPGDVVCHPSKAGPWSSLVGAVREHLAVEAVHLVFRLDRETSGLVVLAKDPAMGSQLQKAAQERCYRKVYQALLTGKLTAETTVDQPLGDDTAGPVWVKSRVVPAGQGQSAITTFTPLAENGGFTLARVVTATGRKHQIRAHAQWLGHSLVGDKIYGPDARLFIEFIETGWTPAMAEKLLMTRQALHCGEIDLRLAGLDRVFRVGLPADMKDFCRERMGLTADVV